MGSTFGVDVFILQRWRARPEGLMGVRRLAFARRIWSKPKGRRLEWRMEDCTWGLGDRLLMVAGRLGKGVESTRALELESKMGIPEKGSTQGGLDRVDPLAGFDSWIKPAKIA